MQAAQGLGHVVFADDEGDVDLGRALRNHAHVDLAEGGKYSGGDPGVSRIFSPTRQTIALRPAYFTSAIFSRSAAMAGIASLESTVSETLTSEVETTSMEQ